MYYESNNIFVKINGNRPETLLISAHFDSTENSHGATDDGIAVASIMTVLKTLSKSVCDNRPEYSLLFFLNNGEELGMLGASAFIYHPLFKSIKAFINLEGTGVSRNFKSLLFRTNSFPIVSKLVKTNPYPHASISVNKLMESIRSDTDFRPYVAVGGLQGVDVAFYSYRYLYHAPKDDIDHTSLESLQHMADNLYSSITTLSNDKTLIKNLTLDPPADDPFGPIPVPNYLYFDQLGVLGVVFTKSQFVGLLTGVFVAVAGVLFLKSATYLVWLGVPGVKRQVVLPVIGTFLLIILTFVSFVLINLVFSFIRSCINPGFTYANPEVSFFSIVVLCFAVISFMESAWPKLSQRFGLVSESNDDHFYQSLPTHEPLEADAQNDDSHPTEPTLGALPETPNLEVNDQVVDIEPHVEEHLVSGMEDELSNNIQEQSHSRKIDSQSKSLQYGLLLFWTINLCLALYSPGFFYIMFYWAFFSTLATGLTFFVETVYHKLVRQPAVHEPWQVGYVNIYQNYFWFIQLLVSTTIPLLLFTETIRQVIISLPSLVMEGLSDTSIDFLFSILVWISAVNFMPVVSKTCRKYSFAFFFSIYAALLLYQCLRFPYSPDRPFKYGLREVWDVTNSTSKANSTIVLTLGSTITPQDWASAVPAVPKEAEFYKNTISFKSDVLPPLQDKDLIEITESKTLDDIYMKIHGQIIGSKGSRVCKIQLGEIPPYVDFQFDDNSTWIEYVNATLSPIDLSIPFTVYKKNFNHVDRIAIPFKIKATQKFSIPITVNCEQEVGDSNFRAHLDSILAPWNSESLGSELIIRKSHIFK
ncbi:hypothetical protein HDV01_003016 [Terramyces sp. JEL0728]|nr:hypothetical protein HDV01_003016 [Terramyces sp. JEL0728]